MYRLLIFILFFQTLCALDVNEEIPYNELLSHTEIYIDHTQSETMDTIGNKTFKANDEYILGFGYSPKFDVWIKIYLTNISDKPVKKIIEYENPLTSYITFYEADTKKLLLVDGLLNTNIDRSSIHPNFEIILQPKEQKTIYLKAYSDITTLIIKLNLWNPETFHAKEIRYQVVLALFFGAMGLIVLYNFIIFLSTREKSYLYYVLAFIGIIIYYLLYKGVANLYIISPVTMSNIIEYSAFIVAIPVFFLALFTQSILDLKQYPYINRTLNYYLVIFPLLTIIVYIFDFNQYRSFFSVLLLFMLMIITFYALLNNNRQAKFIMAGWLVFFTSGLFMFLSSHGIYDIFDTYPHYTEFSLLIEAIAFSLSLADKIKQLQQSKILLEEKKLLLKELTHRVNNSLQTIISFIQLQKDEINHKGSQLVLQNIENKVFAINDLYALLNTTDNISSVNANDFFFSIITNIRKSFYKPKVTVKLDTTAELNSDDAVYCGLILNETLTNSYQHAFNDTNKGEITVSLHKKKGIYYFNIKDNGIGYNTKGATDSLGMTIIETLAIIQLEGKLNIDTTDGLETSIIWKDNG
ncbi:MAG: Signal Transduction Histidine Kinase [uncultured Sulfurovum sp.]|uniref:histidine kinase n=1 Tax=uncultured Sulfurovum sp. TaxID=269237 RepID=A0A6S6SV14_9BACT|nr:MAG: Signal Transduction Histidine Kinase [uncultured Sulfurovum sp.]